MTPQEELKQIYKEGIEIDLREDRSYEVEYENFTIDYEVDYKRVYIHSILNKDGNSIFYEEAEKLEDFLTESNQKDWDISDAEEFGNINY